MASKGFDLGAALAEVSGLDHSADQIVRIDIDLIDGDPANFYSTEGIDELAENIELVGLLDPLRVRLDPDRAGRYLVVSGHRRRLAIRKIVDDGNADFRGVPCIVEKTAASPAMQELRMIYANSDTRTMTSADLSKQAERVEALLYELKQQGVEFPGRMREHVAEVCKISQSKLARLKVIREKLHPELKPYWESGKMSETSAYAAASAGQGVQEDLVHYVGADRVAVWYEWRIKSKVDLAKKIKKRECKKCGGTCSNVDAMLQKSLPNSWSDCEYHCCETCTKLPSCSDACALLADTVAELKQQKEEEEKSIAEQREQVQREQYVRNTAAWNRFMRAAAAVHKSNAELLALLEERDAEQYSEDALSELNQRAAGTWTGGYGVVADTPFDLLFDVGELVFVADALSCTTDFLLGRTDELKPAPRSADAEPPQLPDGAVTWQTGLPDRTGDVNAVLQNGAVIQTRRCWYDHVAQAFYFRAGGQQIDGVTCLGWLPIK